MEVLGTVAATAQLLGMAMKILESISQLHDLVKHVPGRYHSWDAELTILGEMIYYIQRTSALQTFHVGRVIANISPKVEHLVLLCREHSPQSKAKPLKRVLTTLSACAVEPRILRRFESLEQDKTTLLLAINLHIASNPLATEDMSKRTYEETREGPTEGPGNTHADAGQSNKTLVLVHKKDNNSNTPERRDVHTPGSQPKKHDIFSSRQCDTGEFGLPQQRICRRSTYSEIKVDGSSNGLGTSRGDGAEFKKIDMKGSCHILGDHEPDVFLNIRAHAGSKCARVRRSRRNVPYSRSSKNRSSAKGAPSEVALRGKAVNKDDYGKPDYES